MSDDAASALPAGLGERLDDDLFPLRERLRFRDNLGLGLRDIRRRPAFGMLARGPWQVFIAIACHWQANAEAWPSQDAIAGFTGYTSRAVRDYVDELENRGLVRLRRERRPNGADRIYYAPGPVTLGELASFVERFPKTPAKARPSHPPETSSGGPSHPPEAVSGAPPEASSMEPRDQDQRTSSCGSSAPATPASPEEEQPRVTTEDREIARAALGERMKRKHPKRPPPRWFDRPDVEFVATCTAAVEGDREAKLQAHRDALDGAFSASKDGPPTSRFVWGTLAHFFEHSERGRTTRLREQARADQEAARVAGSPPARVAVSVEPRVDPARIREDIARLLGRLR